MKRAKQTAQAKSKNSDPSATNFFHYILAERLHVADKRNNIKVGEILLKRYITWSMACFFFSFFSVQVQWFTLRTYVPDICQPYFTILLSSWASSEIWATILSPRRCEMAIARRSIISYCISEAPHGKWRKQVLSNGKIKNKLYRNAQLGQKHCHALIVVYRDNTIRFMASKGGYGSVGKSEMKYK